MTAEEVIEKIAALPEEDWIKIQSGIADLMMARLSSGEVAEIECALSEAEFEFEKGAGCGSEDARLKLSLQ